MLGVEQTNYCFLFGLLTNFFFFASCTNVSCMWPLCNINRKENVKDEQGRFLIFKCKKKNIFEKKMKSRYQNQ